MYKYIATWSYRGAINTHTFVTYFESKSSCLVEIEDKIRAYLCSRYNWPDINLSVSFQMIDYITI